MLVLAGASVFALSLVAASALLPIVRRRSIRKGFLDAPGGRKAHRAPIPYGGGLALLLAIFLPVAAGAAAALVLTNAPGVRSLLPADVSIHLPGVRRKLVSLAGIALGAVLVGVVGHLDDRKPLSPWTKLAAETAAALVLVFSGVRATLFFSDPWIPSLVTVVWVVFLTNCFNFLDNQDGLLATVSLGVTALLTILAVRFGELFVAAFLLAISGGLVAFLRFNFPPARLFIGDSGSLAIGFVLAAASIVFSVPAAAPGPLPALVPILVLGVPLCDGLLVVVSRLRRGVSPFTAGRDHSSHRVIARGVGPRRLLLVFLLLTLATGGPVTVLLLVTREVPAGLLQALFATVLALLLATAVLAAFVPRGTRIEEPA